MDGILWVLRTNSPWKALPADYPPYQTCHRRLQAWIADGTMSRVVEVLIDDLCRRGALDLRWMRSTRPDTLLYQARHEQLRPPPRRGRPDWRVHTLELLLSPRMARMLVTRCGWTGDTASTERAEIVDDVES
jgi:hypothetical protein